jgi:4-carboxymuconolactone decarboxylase
MRNTYSMRGIWPMLAAPAVLLIVGGCSARGDTAPDPDDATAPVQATSGAYAGSPYLGELRNKVLYGDIWERPQLSKRNRSMVTIAFLQALDREEMRGHMARGLDSGLTSEEISEIILHVTFYAGWPTGVHASRMAAELFRERGLPVGEPAGTWQPPTEPPRTYTSGAYAAVPKLGELRNSLLYGDVWERPQLSKRDRSMITVAVAQATYATDELRGHLRRALDDNGVTREELSEIILQGAFYAGWPGAVNAGRLAAELFEERGLTLGQPQ